MQLPMWQFRPQVLKAVDDNQVVIVCGETGWYGVEISLVHETSTNTKLVVERVLRYLHSCWNMSYPRAGIARFTAQNHAESRPSLWLDV
jgi:hypothetical protein